MPDPIKKTFVKVKKSKESSKKDIKEDEVQGLELTPKYDISKKKINKTLEATKEDVMDDKAQGFNVSKSTSVAKPKIFIRKTESIGDKYTGTTIIRGKDGSKVYEGRTNMKATQDAIKESDKKVKNTNEDRNTNANTYNVMAGSKSDLNEKDKDMLVSIKSANRVSSNKK